MLIESSPFRASIATGSSLVALLLLSMLPRAVCADAVVTHELDIALDPDLGTIQVIDRISLPESPVPHDVPVEFSLNAAFTLSVDQPEVFLKRVDPSDNAEATARYRVTLPAQTRDFTLRYGGRLRQTTDFAAGHIGPEGVYLSGASRWYPGFGDRLMGVSMTVEMPLGWSAVSQGQRRMGASSADTTKVQWNEVRPQQDLYLVAGPFHAFEREGDIAQALVYLRAPDPALAERYLDATERYVSLYSRLIGPYPYEKFALVENFWETGYGMPSFTLLGSRVIRLPFILHTSYPHEILHNWWGNGVYVDYRRGNWSEGLTAYLADHLVRELKGEGADYRRNALQKYRNYVDGAKDFSLRRFAGKAGEASAAVGYNKALMLFHMLRRRLGDRDFVEGLRRIYRENRFKPASYDDLRQGFEAVSVRDLTGFFAQWVERIGAPVLAVEGIRVSEDQQGFRVTGMLRQSQPGAAYHLSVPVTVQTVRPEALLQTNLEMTEKELAIDLRVPARPLEFLVDPEFDVFRRLHRAELPPTLGELFGSDETVAVLPSAAEPDLMEAYRVLARGLGATRVLEDGALEALPDVPAVWLLGWQNRFRETAAATLKDHGVGLSKDAASIDGTPHSRKNFCMVLAARTSTTSTALAWLGCDAKEALPGLGRKLPYYGKYSFLGFEGDGPSNRLKGRWTVNHSPLHVILATDAVIPKLELPPRPPLTAQAVEAPSE